jgi:hypothetical protein
VILSVLSVLLLLFVAAFIAAIPLLLFALLLLAMTNEAPKEALNGVNWLVSRGRLFL